MTRSKYYTRADFKYRLTSRWQDVWGDWQFWWERKSMTVEDAEWESVANGDLEWAGRMSNHYKIIITGEYADEKEVEN